MGRIASIDALLREERAILNGWDAGMGSVAIAHAVGVSEERAYRVVSRFSGRPEDDWTRRARDASRRLHEACVAAGGSFA